MRTPWIDPSQVNLGAMSEADKRRFRTKLLVQQAQIYAQTEFNGVQAVNTSNKYREKIQQQTGKTLEELFHPPGALALHQLVDPKDPKMDKRLPMVHIGWVTILAREIIEVLDDFGRPQQRAVHVEKTLWKPFPHAFQTGGRWEVLDPPTVGENGKARYYPKWYDREFVQQAVLLERLRAGSLGAAGSPVVLCVGEQYLPTPPPFGIEDMIEVEVPVNGSSQNQKVQMSPADMLRLLDTDFEQRNAAPDDSVATEVKYAVGTQALPKDKQCHPDAAESFEAFKKLHPNEAAKFFKDRGLEVNGKLVTVRHMVAKGEDELAWQIATGNHGSQGSFIE